ncbi:PHP domain-containing protein [Chitinispirillales bacterium ANBcel5]|uniref:PHP domain-containing protein n=1 Tax=Cellulosispirillum alkaliphilum TaxID=3039283 RepID=UPI002A51C55E|nr:PHP domain-containing protein [Chitinispirillales bacterium ANBcel5]
MFNSKEANNQVCGALHLHTTYSDGGATYEELISVAKQIGLDFIITTDHMNMNAKENGVERFHDDLLLIVGYEHNDANNLNHYLVIGTDKVFKDLKQPQHYIDAVKDSGGIGFLAHPAERRNYFGKLPPYPWTQWDVTGYDGIELWNQMSEWIEQLKSWKSAFKLLYPRRFLGTVPTELLERWDQLNQKRFVSCVGGVDAHTRVLKIGPFNYTVFPIKVELKGIRNHLYLDTPLKELHFREAKVKVMQSLKKGHGFISNFRRGDARGSNFLLHTADNRTVWPGMVESESTLPAKLQVSLPSKGTIVLYKNGILQEKITSKNACFPIASKGCYRVEVYKGKNAWIYTNPFPVGSYPF